MKRFRLWHMLLRHHVWCDINRVRMASFCDCGETWIYGSDRP